MAHPAGHKAVLPLPALLVLMLVPLPTVWLMGMMSSCQTLLPTSQRVHQQQQQPRPARTLPPHQEQVML